MISRRDFVHIAAGAMVYASTASAGQYQQLSPRSTVACIGNAATNIDAAVKTAIALAGGIDEIKQGDTVLIKPNIVSGDSVSTTNPSVLRAVIRAVKEKTASANIFVGDAGGSPTRTLAEKNGILNVVTEEQANFIAFEEGAFVAFEHPRLKYLPKGIRIAEKTISATHYINVPRLKQHPLPSFEFTCCIKAFVGHIHMDDRWNLAYDFHNWQNGENRLVELNLSRPVICMNIVDALEPVVKWDLFSTSVSDRADIILASKDRVACDAFACAVLRFFGRKNNRTEAIYSGKIWEKSQILYGAQMGLGCKDPQEIEIISRDMQNLDAIMKDFKEGSSVANRPVRFHASAPATLYLTKIGSRLCACNTGTSFADIAITGMNGRVYLQKKIAPGTWGIPINKLSCGKYIVSFSNEFQKINEPLVLGQGTFAP